MLLLISIISFLAIHAAPNSFLSAGELNPNMTIGETIEELILIWGASDISEYQDMLIYLPLS